MTKVDIRRLDSVTTNDTTATQLINENFTALQTAIENTISRDGTTPNFMDADLDLNSYKIINAGTPTNNTDLVTKEYFDEHVGDAAGYAADAEASANRAAIAAQAAQGYSTAASGAADVAQRARDFIESDPGFVAVSTDLLLGEDSSIKKTSDDLTNIDTVAESIANVNAVGTDITNVNSVADDLTNIDNIVTNMTDINNVADDLTKIVAVADDLTKIDNVADDLTNIDNVADDLTNIDAVADNITNINAVADNESNINAVVGNETNINAVNANKTNIDAVAGNNANITAVANNATNINAVNANKTNIDTVATNIADVNSVATDIAKVTAVADDLTNIDAVVENATNINTVAGDITNINAVAADLTNIDAASGYAAEAKQWAIGDPTEPTGGSAKYWAQQSAASQVQADWLESDTSAKGYIRNKPTAGDNISFANNEISAVSDVNPTQNSTNLVQSGGVYTACNTLQQEIDTILLSSDVYDVVGTYTDLQNYDISTVPVNDIIKVLSDSTHSDAASYYRCTESGGVKSWVYVGSEGPYYTKSEANTLLNGKANIDLDNLSQTGQAVLDAKQDVATAVNYDNITNCITEIPQDIKLELDNGTLTLKAGSKVYVPNGFETDGTTPHFDVITTTSDIVHEGAFSTATNTMVLLVNMQSLAFVTFTLESNVYSGNTQPTSPVTNSLWYDTANNIMKNTTDGGSTWNNDYWCLPIALVHRTSGTPDSINQVFNGFGYIGSTVFALPGVKGLVSNGRNTDGSLKNLEFTISNVLTQTTTNTAGKTWGLYFNNDGSFAGFSIGIYEKNIRTLSDRPAYWSSGYFIHVEDENRNYVNQNANPSAVIMVASIVIGSSSITSLTPKTTFHAPDWYDFEKAALKEQFQVVTALPANPDADVFYFVKAS